jgi:nicotinamide mononucleotide adenylyltransferase
LVRSFELLRKRPEVGASGVPIPQLASFSAWTRSSPSLGNPDLETAARLSGDPELASVLAWSKAVNAEIAAKVVNAPMFRWARMGLEKIHAHSDAICVSQTPTEALVREWTAGGIIGMVSFIAGQELGTKAEHIALATSGKYAPDRIMMIGDALGDKDAARANGAMFYPINPSREEASWELFCEEAFDRFLNGTYAGDYAARLIDDFDRLLPREPTWQQ